MESYIFMNFAVVFFILVGKTLSDDPVWQKNLPISCLTCTGVESCKMLSTVETKCSENNEQCITLFNVDNKVMARGCSKTIAQQECKKTGQKCYYCKTNKCNKATNKNDFKSCLSCNTVSNPNCISDVGSISDKKDCYRACMVALYPKDSSKNPSYELVRSCLDDKEEPDHAKCNGAEESNCKACNNKDDCNNFMIPEIRLKCYQCRGAACSDPNEKSTICVTYQKDDACVFIFDDNKNFEEAQCKSALPKSKAEVLEKAGRLISCTGNDCNSFEKIPKPVNCIVCDSNREDKCATDPELVTTINQCDFNHCYTQIFYGATKRGCFSSLDSEQQATCTLTSTECTRCMGDKCNNKIYPENRRKCHRCISFIDKDCVENPKQSKVCSEYVADDACVTKFEKISEITERGCLSEFSCKGKDPKMCQICKNEDSCNIINLKKENSSSRINLTVGATLAIPFNIIIAFRLTKGF